MHLLRMNRNHRSDVFLKFFISRCSEILISRRISLYSFLQRLLEQEILHYCCLQMGRYAVLSDAARHILCKLTMQDCVYIQMQPLKP